MLPKISNFCHVLKARVVVAYALFYVFRPCSGIHLGRFFRVITRRILFLIRHPVTYFNSGFPKKVDFTQVYTCAKETYNTLYRDFFKEYIAHRKTPLADYVYVKIDCTPMGSYFSRIIATAWLCEKLRLNVKFTFPNTYIIGSTNFFENTILSYAKTCYPENFERLKKPLVNLDYRKNYILPSLWEAFGKRIIPNEYGYKIISTLSIKQEIRQQADQWYRANIKGKCVGVHYRQGDALDCSHIIKIERYIDYLKQVLDDSCMIYACSDNEQFIETIHKELSGRVASRDITRSKDYQSLHRHEAYAGDQQRKDALIDILTLAKTEIIYTVGSQFVHIIRFFNPSIKIISLDGRGESWYRGRFLNYLPASRQDLIREAQKDDAWKAPILNKKTPEHIEYKRE